MLGYGSPASYIVMCSCKVYGHSKILALFWWCVLFFHSQQFLGLFINSLCKWLTFWMRCMFSLCGGLFTLMIYFQYQCLSCKNPRPVCMIYLDTQMFYSYCLHHALAIRLFPFENCMSWRCDCVTISFFYSALDECNHWLDVWEWPSLPLFPILFWKKIGLCFLISLFEFQRVVSIPCKWLHGISIWCLGDLISMEPPCRV